MILTEKQLISVNDAAKWASEFTNTHVTVSNIMYLVQYGRVKKYESNAVTQISLQELEEYYTKKNGSRENEWKKKFGNDINWALSFEEYKEAETTKHVHRLHPYKGKFIPQLVEYFLDDHTDSFKKEKYFKPGDIVLDPFCGSGTTLVQACELGLHSIGVDISAFNTLISNSKVDKYDLKTLQQEIDKISTELKNFLTATKISAFEEKLMNSLYEFNKQYFPVPDYKYQLRQGNINEKIYGAEKEKVFFDTYSKLIKEFNIELHQPNNEKFIDKWYLSQVRKEIDFVFSLIKNVENKPVKKMLSIILSRTIRSCRATTHSDLATLIDPVKSTYYCTKHGKICKPLFSILKWWESYSKDTLKRLKQFETLKKDVFHYCLTGDSRTIDIIAEVEKTSKNFAKLINDQKIRGIFSSPPYVGLIDYHEQHAYAYDIFGFERNDNLEIGPLFKGKGKEARKSYVDGLSAVLNNCRKFLVEDFDIFLVANDKFELYPTIAENSNMIIVNQFHRPVLNRTEKDKTAYSETIFHLKNKK